MRVAEAAAAEGDPVVDIGRGNPDIPPPEHVVEALVESRARATRRCTAIRRCEASPSWQEDRNRYATVYGVALDPEREVAVVRRGDRRARRVPCRAGRVDPLARPRYPDYSSGVALAGATEIRVVLDPDADFAPDLAFAPQGMSPRSSSITPPTRAPRPRPTACSRKQSNTPSEPAQWSCTTSPTPTSSSTGTSRRASSRPRARRMSASRCSPCRRAMGWRGGGSASSRERRGRCAPGALADHIRTGIFEPVQRAGIAALTGPQDIRKSAAPSTSDAATGARSHPQRALRRHLLRVVSASGRNGQPTSSRSSASLLHREKASASPAAAGPASHSRLQTSASSSPFTD